MEIVNFLKKKNSIDVQHFLKGYDGDWNKFKMQGKGELIKYKIIGETSLKFIYNGQFLNSKKHGLGRYVWPDGRYF